MAEPTRSPDTGEDHTTADAGRPSKPGLPRWLKVSLVIVIAVLALLVVLSLTGVLGQHGPEQFGPGQH
jgi:hypothetical protein